MKYGNQVISSIRLGSQAIITKIAKGLVIVYEACKTLIKRGKSPLEITNCEPNTSAIDYTIYGGNDFKTILPDEYQQVEYIQTTGTQYIDSKVPLKGGLKTIVDWIYEETSGSNSYTGGHIGSPGNRWLIGSQRQNKQYFFAVGTGNTTTGIPFGNRDVVEAYWADKASYIKVNGVQSTYSFDHLTLGDEPSYTFYISAVNRDGRVSSRSKLTIYSWKFYQDDILVRDYVPCYRKSDRVAGLYDMVTNEFYTNDGTGEFVVGESTFPIPAPEAPIELKGVGDYNDGTYDYTIPIAINDMYADIYTKQPLRKIGGCADRLNYSTQSIIKNLGYYQFNGTENWEEHTAAQGCKVYRLDSVLTPKIGALMSDTYMTHFGLTYTYSTADFTPGFYRFASGNPVDIISSGRLYISSTCETVEEFKEWLSANKPGIYYPLAENEIIDIELPELYLPNETNIITVDTEVSPDAIEITYKGRE